MFTCHKRNIRNVLQQVLHVHLLKHFVHNFIVQQMSVLRPACKGTCITSIPMRPRSHQAGQSLDPK